MSWWVPLIIMGATQIAQQLQGDKSEEARQRLAEIENEMSNLGLRQYWNNVQAAKPLEAAYRGIIDSPQYQTAAIESELMPANQNYGLAREKMREEGAKYGLTGSGGYAQDMGTLEGNRWLAALQAKQNAADKQFGLQQTYTSLGRGLPSQAASGLSGAANTGFGLYQNYLNQDLQQQQGLNNLGTGIWQIGSEAGWW